MMQLGNLSVTTVNFGFFRLDGGSMFGSVPKNLWAKRIPADEENCIRLATRCLLVRDSSSAHTFLVDVGMGEKWGAKQRQIFAIDNSPSSQLPFEAKEITDVVLTHLHFDHAGGVTKYAGSSDKLELVYPNARVFLQASNLENAKSPTVKEKASYLPENFVPLEQSELMLVDGDVEIHPGIVMHCANGHTRGQQWIELRGGGKVLFYPTDLIPTQHHLPIPFHMGYDACAETILKDKAAFLERAVAEQAVVVFEHDADLAACTVKLDERGHYAVDQRVEL